MFAHGGLAVRVIVILLNPLNWMDDRSQECNILIPRHFIVELLFVRGHPL